MCVITRVFEICPKNPQISERIFKGILMSKLSLFGFSKFRYRKSPPARDRQRLIVVSTTTTVRLSFGRAKDVLYYTGCHWGCLECHKYPIYQIWSIYMYIFFGRATWSKFILLGIFQSKVLYCQCFLWISYSRSMYIYRMYSEDSRKLLPMYKKVTRRHFHPPFPRSISPVFD